MDTLSQADIAKPRDAESAFIVSYKIADGAWLSDAETTVYALNARHAVRRFKDVTHLYEKRPVVAVYPVAAVRVSA